MIVLYDHHGPQRPSATLLTAVAADYTGLPLHDPRLRIVRSRDQRPVFPQLPGHFFSVSHSADRWMCAAGAYPLGLDLQVHQPCSAGKLSTRFFHPEEDAWLRARGYDQTDFFQVWTRKEAYVKYTGLGITQGLEWFSVVADGALRTRLDDVWFLSPDAPEGFSLCLCVQAKEDVILRPFAL